MATIKLKTKPAERAPSRPPIRGGARRPTLSEAQTRREREMHEQRPPRDEGRGDRPGPRRDDRGPYERRDAGFGARPERREQRGPQGEWRDGPRPSRPGEGRDRPHDRPFDRDQRPGRDARGPGPDRPRSEGYGGRPDQRRNDRPYGDRQGDRPQGERGYGDRPRSDRPYGDRPRPYGDRLQGDRPQGERPYGDRPQGDRPPRERGYGDERPRGPRPDRGDFRPDFRNDARGDFRGERRDGPPQGYRDRPDRPRDGADQRRDGPRNDYRRDDGERGAPRQERYGRDEQRGPARYGERSGDRYGDRSDRPQRPQWPERAERPAPRRDMDDAQHDAVPPRRLDPARPVQPESLARAQERAAASQQPGERNATGERLSKRLGEMGLASRREADDWIDAGWVRVDGKVAVLGQRVSATARIEIDPAARESQAQRMTVLLHKPIGYVSGQAEDGYEPASVLIKPETRWEADPSHLKYHPGHLRGLAPAGRLDIDSTGLLVLTQDGRVARTLIGDDSNIEKEYLVRVEYSGPEEKLPDSAIALMQHGLELDGVPLRPAKVSWQNEDQLRVVLREGRKRQIRRMCEAVGLKVLGLKRVRIGRITLGALPPGQWRYLAPWEKF
ncbi:MAG: hypothetical protein RJA44_982 [Pseudomonadota bacterium]